MKDIAKLRKFFEKDRYIIRNGIEIVEINEKFAVCSVDVNDNHLNANNVVQGGMIYTIADFTFAVLSNYLCDIYAVSQSATISFLRPAACKKLFARSEELSATAHNCVHKVTVYDENDSVIAIAQINGFIK